jgi:hypothetical protein
MDPSPPPELMATFPPSTTINFAELCKGMSDSLRRGEPVMDWDRWIVTQEEAPSGELTGVYDLQLQKMVKPFGDALRNASAFTGMCYNGMKIGVFIHKPGHKTNVDMMMWSREDHSYCKRVQIELRDFDGNFNIKFHGSSSNIIHSLPAGAYRIHFLQTAPTECESDLHPGVVCEIAGLVAAAQHNGKSCTLTRFYEATGRWDVRLQSGQGLSVRPQNLHAVLLLVAVP